MRKLLTSAVLVASFAAIPFVVGCDETLKKDETTKTNADGTTSKEETKVVKKADGTIQKTQESVKDNTPKMP